jgi:serine/threonine protein phosphatase 1
MMVRAVENPGAAQLLDKWLEYGGYETLQSYGLKRDDDLQAGIPAEHLRWMSGLPRTAKDKHRIFVHAGLIPGTAANRQTDEACLWIRERFLTALPGDFEAHVVHGHTPVWQGKPDPAEPELLEHRTNLDTGAFATGVLSVAVFQSAIPGGPIEVLKIRDAAAPPIASDPTARRRRGFGGWLAPTRSRLTSR